MRVSRPANAVFSVTTIALLTLTSGCQSSRLGKIPRPGWFSWGQNNSDNAALASNPSTTSPALPSNGALPTQPPVVSGVSVTNGVSSPGYGGPKYSTTTNPSVAYPVSPGNSAGASGYAVGPYATGASGNGSGLTNPTGRYAAPRTQTPGGISPQKGFYSANTVPEGGPQAGIYTTDARSAAGESYGASNNYGTDVNSRYNNRHDNPPNSTAGNNNNGYPYPNTNYGARVSNSTNPIGSYSTPANTNGRYVNPPVGPQDTGGYAGSTGYDPSTNRTASPAAGAGYSYGDVAPPSSSNAPNTYNAPAIGSRYNAGNSSPPTVGNPPAPVSTPAAGTQPWRPGSTTDLPQTQPTTGPADYGSGSGTAGVVPATYGTSEPSNTSQSYSAPNGGYRGSYPTSGTPSAGY